MKENPSRGNLHMNKILTENLFAFTEKSKGVISERKRDSNLFLSFDF